MKRIAFLASSKMSSESIMRCYDWATEVSRQDVEVVSGFSSQLERDVLHFLLRGTCRIKLVMARTPYKRIPQEYADYVASGRMDIISISESSRQTRKTAFLRNLQIANEVDEIVFSSLNERSSLYKIYLQYIQKSKILAPCQTR